MHRRPFALCYVVATVLGLSVITLADQPDAVLGNQAQQTVSQPATTLTATNELESLRAENRQLRDQVAQLEEMVSRLREQLAALQPIQASGPGYSRLNPAPVGTALKVSVEGLTESYTAEVTLLEVIRGQHAWDMIRAANRLNAPPKTGHEYLAAKIRFSLLSMKDVDARLSISPVSFAAISARGVEYQPLIGIVPPEPAMMADLYAGATHEGWAVFLVSEGDDPLIAYGRDYQGRGGIWFKTKS